MAVAISTGEAVPREPRRLHAFLAHYPRIAAGFAMVVGAITLFGWIMHISVITYPIPRLPLMVPNAALMSMLAGMSLWLLTGARRARGARIVAIVSALVVGLFGLTTLLEYTLETDLDIDEIVPVPGLGPWPNATPGWYTAIAFVFTAIALLAFDRRSAKGRYHVEEFGLLVAAIATFTLLGYLFGVPAMYGHTADLPRTGVSVPTAFVLFSLAFGFLTLHINSDGVLSTVVARDAGGIVARQLLVGVAAFPPIAVAVIAGARLGWYALSVASALVLFFTVAEASVFILATARRLSRFDASQRQISNELRASEARVRTLVEQAPDAIFLADQDGHYTDVNPAGCAMLGYRLDELIGKTIADLVAPAELSRLQTVRDRVTAGGTARGEFELLRKDGSSIEVEFVANMLSDRRRQAIARDVSERKEFERLREEWIAVVAHELRQPVTAIVAATGILYDKLAPGREPEILAGLREAAFRLNRMVEDLLDVARIAANRLSVEFNSVDVVETVTHAIEQVRLAHPGVQLALDAPVTQPAWMDRARIEQVLGNLLSNAIKYRKPDTMIRVEVRQIEETIRVGVHNEGTPIDPEELPRLFGRFARTREARASQRGVGLGLYICKGLVEAHRGRIWIESKADQTSVYFTVPASQPSPQASPVAAAQ